MNLNEFQISFGVTAITFQFDKSYDKIKIFSRYYYDRKNGILILIVPLFYIFILAVQWKPVR